MAAWLLRLVKTTTYLSDDDRTPDSAEVNLSNAELLVAELLLHHLQLLQFNSHEVNTYIRSKYVICIIFTISSIYIYIYIDYNFLQRIFDFNWFNLCFFLPWPLHPFTLPPRLDLRIDQTNERYDARTRQKHFHRRWCLSDGSVAKSFVQSRYSEVGLNYFMVS